jgi:hypothetical protein
MPAGALHPNDQFVSEVNVIVGLTGRLGIPYAAVLEVARLVVEFVALDVYAEI